MSTKIIKCNCKHEYQDNKYGNSKRVHNKTIKVKPDAIYRCTVCQSEKMR